MLQGIALYKCCYCYYYFCQLYCIAICHKYVHLDVNSEEYISFDVSN